MRKTLSLALAALAVPNVQVSRQEKILDPDEEERRDQAKGTALVVAAYATTLGMVSFAFLVFA
jgi:hypothetical protein